MDRPLTRHDYRTLSLAALGGALEFYDFVIYVFLAPVIGQLFFPADMPDWLRLLQTFGIFSAGYLARPLGGILIAPLFQLADQEFTLIVLGALAAVALAGLRSIPIAFAGGLLLGVLQNIVYGYGDTILPGFLNDLAGLRAAIPFILTVVLLFFFLAFDRTRAAGSVADESPPEDHRAGLPAWRRTLPWAIAVGALVVYELWFANEFWSGLIAKGIVLGLRQEAKTGAEWLAKG